MSSLSSGSFMPPGGGNFNLPVNTPLPTATPQTPTAPPAQASTFSGVVSQSASPVLNTVLTGQIAPENMTQLIHDIPNIMSGLSPDEQDKFLQLLMSSDILNAMFSDLEKPETRKSFDTLVKSLFETGMLSQVAPDKAVLPEDQQTALKDALQQKLVQTLQQQTPNPPQKGAQDSRAQGSSPQDSGVVATGTQTADTPPTTSTLNIPVAQKGAQNEMPEGMQTLVAGTVTDALQEFFSSGIVTTSTPNSNATTNTTTPQTAQQQATLPNQIADFVKSLISLGIQTTPQGALQLAVPLTPQQPANLQTLTQQLNQISEQFTKLGNLSSQENWDIGPLNNFVSVPATLLTMLKSIQPDDTTTTNMLKTWVDNSEIVNTAILNRANDVYKEKFEFIKTIMLSSATQLPQTAVKEQQMRQQMFEQVLMAAPALLNVFKLKDMVGVFEDDVKRKHAAILFRYKRMLYNAAHEIVVVASGKPTFEYNDVGVFHRELPILAHKIELMLPESAEALDFDLMEVIARDIGHTFTYIKEEAPRQLNDIMKRHPRTLLYLRASDSPITQDIMFPRAEALGVQNDPLLLNQHFLRIMNVVKSFQKNSEFLKFQPKVLEAFIDEAKYDPTSLITKTSLDIVHKAVADSSGFIDLE
ncbi:MAG: hypothetical protein JSR37_06730 [Verrucomicrobia bacterium]|nr:hypothetical protein [Verrucomicrobiota bacterium]MBS0636799.1 hypothetical protein [Verrucomicrobiota bacterium]